MIKQISFALFLIVSLLSTADVKAQETPLSVGGTLSGLTAKYGHTDAGAARADLSFLLIDTNLFNLDLYYQLYLNDTDLDIESGDLRPYLAPGINIGFTDATNDLFYGLTFPVGIEYVLEDAPFEVFFETGPYVQINPSQLFGMSGTIGFRYRI
ncbi:MAG TPA: hypothetical protein DEQ34_02005 [Balneolaceae bacterium]|nr:hypothetical protein [Balneolaceae bacterium]|tara:strand:+ start:3137 stop:3598 length:462 start_codon:yes stop_codon:yes gene_type:complete